MKKLWVFSNDDVHMARHQATKESQLIHIKQVERYYKGSNKLTEKDGNS